MLLIVAGVLLGGCASPEQKRVETPYTPQYAKLAEKYAEIYEIVKANEWRANGHKWRALAYMEWRKEVQHHAFEMARKSFEEAAKWFYDAKAKYPDYSAYVDEELKSVYGFIAMCIMEQPELQEIPQASVEEPRELEQAIQHRLDTLSKTVQQWEQMRGR
jgi:hypothetical protein